MEENIVVISNEEETEINYSFVFTREEAASIIQNTDKEFLELSDERWIMYQPPTIVIKPKGSCQAYLNMIDVHRQIQDQLEG